MRKQDCKGFASSVRDAISRGDILRFVYIDDQGRFRSCSQHSRLYPKMEANNLLVGVYDEHSSFNQIYEDMIYSLSTMRETERRGRIASGARA